MSKVSINNTLQLVNSKSSTLLETMESAGLEPEFNCRDGHCGACRCRLNQGEVEYVGFAMAYLEENEILPCISRAKTDISISDVKYQERAKTA
jgi:ferredoxin